MNAICLLCRKSKTLKVQLWQESSSGLDTSKTEVILLYMLQRVYIMLPSFLVLNLNLPTDLIFIVNSSTVTVWKWCHFVTDPLISVFFFVFFLSCLVCNFLRKVRQYLLCACSISDCAFCKAAFWQALVLLPESNGLDTGQEKKNWTSVYLFFAYASTLLICFRSYGDGT